MHLGSVYLVVNDFEKSIAFYEKLLEVPLADENNGRFASFMFEGHCISILNGHFDAEHPGSVAKMGTLAHTTSNLLEIALAPNTQKFAFNFWVEDLRAERERIRELGISKSLSGINYLCYVAPYYYFQLADPDGNIVEVTGSYTPEEGEFGS